MRRLVTFFLAGALLLTAACSGGDKTSEGSSDGASRTLFQPAGVVGPDSFAPTFAVASYSVDPSTLTSGDVSGSAPGLYAGRTYGGTGANICDVEAMIRFLTYYEDRGRAWADIQGIEFSELESYLRSLTPVFALQNLNVQMFGFKNGKSYGYDAVIAAGTAILIDDQGMPRARCACGNPLLGPSEDSPVGTDQTPTTEPDQEDGNPQTQDSTPDDGRIPEGPTPDDSIPTDSVPDQPGEGPGPECPDEFEGNTYTDAAGTTWTWVSGNPTPETSPGGPNWFDAATGSYATTDQLDPTFDDCPQPDQPRTQQDPECPDWNADPVRYTDPSGMVWEYDRWTDTWFSTSDADLFKYPTNDLPGYLELCDQPGQRQPGGDCPQQLRGSWTAYYASNGDVWRWEFTGLETGRWVNQDGETVDFLVDIPGFLDDCGKPTDTFQPECPEPINGIGAMDWTPYYASNGDLWVYDAQGDLWKSQDTGSTVAGFDPSAIPGYAEDCGEPPADENPCPPENAAMGDSWTDRDSGETWIFDVSRDPQTGETILVWINTSTGEERERSELFEDECGEPTTTKTVCPPTKAVLGTVWVDATGEEWIFAAGSGGADGWDQVSTPEIENLTYAELPNKPSGCPEPRRPLDCPPILDVPDGYLWFALDGNLYRFSSADGGWVNESDGSGQVVAYTVLLPGYRKYCLPPCPPLNVLGTDAHAVWIDPSNGHLWLKVSTASQWKNTVTGETLADTRDLPFYTEDCLPPCDPESDGGPTYDLNDQGIPETSDEFAKKYGESKDKAVTVLADDAGANPQQIIEQLLEAVTAIGDDCNPNGCVEPNTEPPLGHSFRDAFGVMWRYVGNGEWQAENGDFVTFVLDIPGYVDACLPPDVPLDRECPPEFKGSEYTDGNNLVWTWTGPHSTPEESDHGQYWYYRYEDGTSEYRFTYQLEPFFDDCPKPEGIDVQSTDVFVSLRAPKRACTGEQVPVLMTAWNAEGAIRDGELTLDGDVIDSIESEPGFFNGFFVVDSPGTYVLKGVATDSDGNEGSASIDVVVIDCGDGTIQGDPSEPAPDDSTPDDSTPDESTPEQPAPSGDNTPPVVTVTVTPECIEIDSGQQKTYTVVTTVSDADGDEMTVSLNNGIFGSWTITGSGSQSKVFIAAERNRATTLTFTATADDGQVVTTSNTASVRVEYPDGCQPAESTKPNTAPTVTIATKPAQTVPVCKSGTGSSVPITVSINVSDPQGDDSTVTLASYNETTRLGTTARNVGSVAGAGIVTATETVTGAQIGHTIEYIARADDGTLVGIARTKITVVERTTGCDAENKAPTVVLANKTWPGCIGQNGSPVNFTLGDTAGSKLTVRILVNKAVVQTGTKDIPLTGTASITYTFTAQMIGQAVVVEVTDEKGLKGQSLTTTLTKEVCPG